MSTVSEHMIDAAFAAFIEDHCLPYMARASEYIDDDSTGEMRLSQIAELRKADGEAERMNREFLRKVLEAAMRAWAADEHSRLSGEIDGTQAAVQAERERIAALGEQHEATYRPFDPDLIRLIPGFDGQPGPDPLGDPFADLIRSENEK